VYPPSLTYLFLLTVSSLFFNRVFFCSVHSFYSLVTTTTCLSFLFLVCEDFLHSYSLCPFTRTKVVPELGPTRSSTAKRFKPRSLFIGQSSHIQKKPANTPLCRSNNHIGPPLLGGPLVTIIKKETPSIWECGSRLISQRLLLAVKRVGFQG